MAKLHLRHERRGVDRPLNGDIRPCPRCHAPTFEFNTRYRIALNSGVSRTVAAWLCDNPKCKLVRIARRQYDTRPAPRKIG
jgi:hypothetical protein